MRTVIIGGAGAMTDPLSGVVRARVEADLAFRVPGKIAERLVDAGAHVTRGQALVRLDPEDYALALNAAEAQFRAAQAQADRTASDERRLRGLAQTGAVSALTYDQARAAADSAAGQAAAAAAQRDVARRQAGYVVLVADADGVVTGLSADVGQVVAAGQPILKLAHDGPREAVIDTPEAMRNALPRQSHAVLLASPGSQGFEATLRQVSGAADPMTRTFEARYVLEANGTPPPLGASIRVELPRPAGAHAGVAVPIGALVDRGGGTVVFVVDRARNVVHRRPVTVAALGEETVQVSAGLAAGETVVSLGANQLQDGQAIRLEPRP